MSSRQTRPHRDPRTTRRTAGRRWVAAGIFGALLCLRLGAAPVALGGPDDPVLSARAVQFDPTLSSVDIEWETDLAADRFDVLRGTTPVGSATAEIGFVTDEGPGFGTHRYTVVARSGESELARAQVSIDIRPAAIPGVYCTQPDPSTPTVVVEWTPPMEYDAIRVRHRGNIVHTLPGTATTVTIPEVAAGRIPVSVCGVVDDVESVLAECRSRVTTAAPSHRFTVRARGSEGTYDPATGKGTITVTVTALEEGAEPGEGTPVQGMQLGTGYDPEVATPVSIAPGPALSSPDFFDGQLLADGVTVGVVLDFMGRTTLDLSTEKELVVTTYEVNVPEDARGGAVEFEVGFRNGLGTGPPVDSTIVVDGKSVRPSLIDGIVTLRPTGGTRFRRGDIDGDGILTLEDIGEIIANLAAPDDARPLDDCLDASDLDDDGRIDLVDLALLVGRVFGEAAPPPEPGDRVCGLDPTIDDLPCRAAPACAD